jgi:heavy metal sensor kinase
VKRSLRWTLLGWYAAILVAVIGALGWALYQRQRSTEYVRLAAQLGAYADAIASALEWDEHDGPELELGDRMRHRLDIGYPDYYFVVWAADGKTVLFQSRRLPDDVRVWPRIGTRPPVWRSPDNPGRRESMAMGPRDTQVVVGRDVADIEFHLRKFAWSILRSCLIALGVALLGGSLLVRRVFGPIERMTATASRISASNLAERIDIGKTESELGRLATVLNEAFDRLQGTIEQQARFTADASHELRTPLAVLRANAEWALRAGRDREDYVETLEAVLAATKRMESLSERLLVLARGDGESGPTVSEPLDLAVLARETAHYLQPLAQARPVALRVTGGPAPTWGDPVLLAEAVSGLVANAIEHGGSGGIVELETGIEDGRALVRVTDAGPGLPEAERKRVFDRFYRVDASRSTSSGGRGLGLSIVKQVVEAHGGTISVVNVPEGGARFTIRLPAAATP